MLPLQPLNPRLHHAWCLTLAVTMLMCTSLWCTASAATPQAAPPEGDTQPREPDEIDALYEAGKSALNDGEAALALGQFKAALHLASDKEHRAWPLLLAVALAYKQTNAPGHAMEYFRRFLALTDANQGSLTFKWKQRRDRVTAVLLELEKELEQTHGFISVTSIPAGAAIVVDGTRAGADRNAVTPFGLILSAGDHMLELAHEGYAKVQRIVTVKAGTIQSLPISLETTAPPKGSSVSEALLAAPTSAKETNVVPWAVMGSAAGIAVAGTVFTVLAAQESAALDDIRAISDDPGAESGAVLGANWEGHVDTLNTYQTVAGVLYGLAGAGLVTGLVLFALPSSDTPEEASAGPTVHIAPAPGGVVGHASWRF